MKRALAISLLIATPASPASTTQDPPQDLPPVPGPGLAETHFRTVEYEPDQVVRLQAALGYQLMVELAPDERIETVAVGDTTTWQVTANKRGDRLFVKPLQAGAVTNMTVATDVRLYSFELVPLSGPEPDMAYAVRFRYHPPASVAPSEVEPSGRYKLAGNAALRPSGMHDDGVHTYIEWPADRALPAIYAIDDNGKEALVNGMMRDGRMVIDSVQQRLVFRIDSHRATAARVVSRP